MKEQMRSWMFVPGNKERFLAKAAACDADCVLLDLEDGVIPESKPEARRMVAGALEDPSWQGPARYVRVNAVTTPWFEDDLAAIVSAGLDGICLSKTEDPETVVKVSALLAEHERRAKVPAGQVRVLAAIESARALIAAPAIAAADDRVVGLIFGAEDYALDIGLGTHRTGAAADLLYARSGIVVAAVAARVQAVDGVFPDLDDPDGLRADISLSRELGFHGKSTFNPRQLDLINDRFSPRPDEIAYARTVVEAFEKAQEAGDASVAVGGQLVDLPIVRRAQRILELTG